eukprot:scaffold27216_cov51-Isochrysis_galbana.AAC.1
MRTVAVLALGHFGTPGGHFGTARGAHWDILAGPVAILALLGSRAGWLASHLLPCGIMGRFTVCGAGIEEEGGHQNGGKAE